MNTRKIWVLLIVIVLSLTLSGCGKKRTIEITYVTELAPQALNELRMRGQGKSVTVAQFVDSRETIGVAGEKNAMGNVVTPYNSSEPVAEVVRDTLVEVFRDAGFRVETMGLWDLDPQAVGHVATAYAMGGEVKVFWAENRPNAGKYTPGGSGFSNVRILFALCDPVSQEIIWQGEIEGGVSRSSMLRTPKLEEMLEKAFAQVIDRLISNGDFIRAFRSF